MGKPVYLLLIRPRLSVALTLLATSLLLAGCAVGPDFKQPAAPATDSYTHEPLPKATASAADAAGTAQQFDLNADISAQWWTLFQSPQLDSLIKKAFQANPTLAAAQAALKQAQELVYAQQGYFILP